MAVMVKVVWIRKYLLELKIDARCSLKLLKVLGLLQLLRFLVLLLF